jgi:hypothetical protein
MPATVAGRIAFWKGLHERFARLGDRIDGETRGRLLGAVRERIPMVTPQEQRALQRENLEADEKFWGDLHDMHAGAVEETRALAAKAESDIAERRAELAKAADRRDAAKAARERLDRGEEEAMMVDHTAEIATRWRQKLAAAEARIQEKGRHNATEADKDNAFKLFTPWKSDKAQSTPTLDDLRERMAGDEL